MLAVTKSHNTADKITYSIENVLSKSMRSLFALTKEMKSIKEICINGKLHFCLVISHSITKLWTTQQCKNTITVEKQSTFEFILFHISPFSCMLLF